MLVGFDLQGLFWVLVVICVLCCLFLIMIGTGQQTVWSSVQKCTVNFSLNLLNYQSVYKGEKKGRKEGIIM